MEDLGHAEGLEDGLLEGEEDGRRVREDEFGMGIGCATGNSAGEGLNFRRLGDEFACLQGRWARSE